MADVYLFPTEDGGDVLDRNGALVLADGLDTAIYLALFGGNEEDSGDDAESRQQWWGNFTEPDSNRHYRSRTQYVLRGLPATTGNLKALREAVEADLATLVTDGTLISASARVQLVAPKRVKIFIRAIADATTRDLEIPAYWQQED